MSNQNVTSILDLTLSRKADLLKLILAACIIALGTNFIANYFSELFNYKTIILIIGLSLIVLVILYLIYKIICDAESENIIEALIPIQGKKICPIFRYKFSESLSETLKAIFLENEALKQKWDEDFSDKESMDKNENNADKEENGTTGYFTVVEVFEDFSKNKNKRSIKLLMEVVEYIILEQLSTHLSTYFNNYDDQDKLIKKYTRSDFPEILLQNRVINLLSTPFEDRAIFAKAGLSKNPPEGEVCSIFGLDGSRFNRFYLRLPKGSTIRRPEDGVLTVENNRLFLELNIRYNGFGTCFPAGFEQNYLGVDFQDVDSRKLEITVHYKIKPIAFFYRSKWNYHKWADSFVDRLIEFASFNYFIEKVNWETNLTGIVMANQRRKRLAETNKINLDKNKK